MPRLMPAPPVSPAEPVTEILHGVAITDPYRWLEEQDSPRTRAWIREQTRYARAWLDRIPGRERIRQRVRELLDVGTYDSLQKAGNHYFFRKRLAGEEQPSIYLREGPDGQDQLLIDPAERGTGNYTAVKPLRVSPDGRLLLYEIKQGGERTGTFALFDVGARRTLPEILPRGYLRGFAFAPDGKSFYYVHEAIEGKRPFSRAAWCHVLGTRWSEDREVFRAGEEEKIRLCLVGNQARLGFVVYRFHEKTRTDFYLARFRGSSAPELVLEDVDYFFGPVFAHDRIFALTDHGAANLRIVELRLRPNKAPGWREVVPESDSRIRQWLVTLDRIVVSYVQQADTRVFIFDFAGQKTGELPIAAGHSARLVWGSPQDDEFFLETESFFEPPRIVRASGRTGESTTWATKDVPLDATGYQHCRLWYSSQDGTPIPLFLVGRREALEAGSHPTIMTAYGGYGLSVTPQFSAFVSFLIERGCLFALPGIRGGSEFGAAWHEAAKRRKRQTAYDDFLGAAEWLVSTGLTTRDKLAIFGGSNSGLLVGAAITQRPELFRATVCIAPMLDMLRYHLFDAAHIWRDEFGTAEDPGDFLALARYSPYHQVRPGVAYPATLIVSGDADRNCNPLHARKMTARLQSANTSGHPVLLDYHRFRGHSPVLPLTDRMEALVDRLAFLCGELELRA
jgi:prolyl oligopeptidase